MLAMLLASCIALSWGDTLFLAEPSTAVTEVLWEQASSWLTAKGDAAVPGPLDDLLFLRTGCGSGNAWALKLNSDVSVRSLTVGSNGASCMHSFVVELGAVLRADSFNASSSWSRVYLNGGRLVVPEVTFRNSAILGGSGAIEGEVALRGDSILYAGRLVVGDSCWPGYADVEQGLLNVTTLRVGPAWIQGGFVAQSSVNLTVVIGDELVNVTQPAAWGVFAERFIVDANTTSQLVFLSPGVFVRFAQLVYLGKLRPSTTPSVAMQRVH
jgi:hypothetical protein